jgi:hypothetical protein
MLLDTVVVEAIFKAIDGDNNKIGFSGVEIAAGWITTQRPA